MRQCPWFCPYCYTTIYKVFARWSDDGSLDQAFIASVRHLAEQDHLDLSILHGDGSNTVAKKGGDGIGYSGHKHQKGEKVLAIVENNGFVLAPLPVAPGKTSSGDCCFVLIVSVNCTAHSRPWPIQ